MNAILWLDARGGKLAQEADDSDGHYKVHNLVT